MRVRIEREAQTPPAASRRPPATARATAVWTACEVCFLFRAPMQRATTTLVPADSPKKKLRNKVMRGPQVPTAAMESDEANRPITARSMALKSTCMTLEIISGMEKRRTLLKSGP